MDKDAKKLVDIYEKLIGSNVNVQKSSGAPGTTLCKIYLKEPTDIDKYRLSVGQIMWYTTQVGPYMANTSIYFDILMSYPGPENWEVLGSFIGHLKGKERKIISVRKPKVLKVVMFCD